MAGGVGGLQILAVREIKSGFAKASLQVGELCGLSDFFQSDHIGVNGADHPYHGISLRFWLARIGPHHSLNAPRHRDVVLDIIGGDAETVGLLRMQPSVKWQEGC